jgi:cystathionine beta-lyase
MMNDGRFRTPGPPITRASTVLFETIAELERVTGLMEAGDPDYSTYGLLGTPTTRALEEVLLAGEGGAGVVLGPSGLAAITTAFLSVVKTGDHVLVTDSAYHPARELCATLLARMGVEPEFFDPLVGAGIADLIRPTTSAIWLESPGSHTFEVEDVPAIVAAARGADHRVVTIIDNTYGSPGLFAPFAFGVDISVVALTKYWGGHSDLLAGATFANEELLPAVRATNRALGMCTNGEEAALAIRGARTVGVRMAVHGASALELARRLHEHPRVGRVLHPGLPDHPGHDVFARDFAGSNGLFAIELLNGAGGPASRADAHAFCDALAARGHFGIGYSWGGFESLVVPAGIVRSARPWQGGALVRLHVGLDPVEVLWDDLAAALGGEHPEGTEA